MYLAVYGDFSPVRARRVPDEGPDRFSVLAQTDRLEYVKVGFLFEPESA